MFGHIPQVDGNYCTLTLILHHLLVTNITMSLAILRAMITLQYHVLWNGKQCVVSRNNCCANPDMPWFFRQLARSVPGETLEVQNCHGENSNNDDTPVEYSTLQVANHYKFNFRAYECIYFILHMYKVVVIDYHKILAD